MAREQLCAPRSGLVCLAAVAPAAAKLRRRWRMQLSSSLAHASSCQAAAKLNGARAMQHMVLLLADNDKVPAQHC